MAALSGRGHGSKSFSFFRTQAADGCGAASGLGGRYVMKRFVLATASSALVASVVLAWVIATPGTAKPPSGTLKIVSKTLVQTGPSAPPKPGDRYVFYDRDSGGDRGHDYFDCVVTNAQGLALCDGQFVLRRGDISVQLVSNLTKTTIRATGAIVGGTG